MSHATSLEGPAYTDSIIIMTTVRLIAPFVLTLGLFVMFHGADTPGGGFQGGTISAAVVLMIAFAFGIEPTRAWLRSSLLTTLIAAGAVAFIGIALGSILLGGAFLEYPMYGADRVKYGIEFVELSIGAIVAGVITALFFVISEGFQTEEIEADPEGGEPR